MRGAASRRPRVRGSSWSSGVRTAAGAGVLEWEWEWLARAAGAVRLGTGVARPEWRRGVRTVAEAGARVLEVEGLRRGGARDAGTVCLGSIASRAARCPSLDGYGYG